MTGSKDAWGEVDRKFSEFGRIVAERYRKIGEERGTPEAEEARRKLEEAFSTVTRQLDQAFSSVGDTIRDPEAKETLKQAGKAVVDALGSTVSDVGEEIRRWRPGSKGDAEGPAKG
ncbi:MAG TPA: hypothetical protein VFK59_00680 [Actinomycetota bacterium]|jgi:hypothetical protein|nr:hypothetical protein [Actinomycetota bacterium]